MKKAIELTNINFEEEIINSDVPVLVDFWAPWCAPCKQMAPILDELAGELEGKVKIAKLDVDSNSQTAGKYNIMSIPSLLFFKNGEVVDQVTGAIPKAQLVQRIEKALA